MPKKYIKKTNRCDISENSINLAIKAVLTKRLSQYKAARDYQVKRQTIQSRIKKMLEKKSREELLRDLEDSGHESEEEHFSSKYTSQQVFTTTQEAELAAYIKRCSDLNYGLNYQQIRVLAYDYSKIIVNCKVPGNWKLNKMAGLDWLRGFMKRHDKELSLRKPENTSLSRSMAFNKPVVDSFFSKYISVLQKYKLKAEKIWNLDETGLTTVMPPIKVVATKGKKQVAHISSQERGELVTFVGIISAAGSTVPPVFVYPRIRNPEEYLGDEYPISAIALGNKKGWMTTELFPKVIEHFASFVKCSVEEKVLLLLDNHESHISVDVIKLCRERGIILLSFPPHTTHRLQPLDVGVYGPFKSYLSARQHDWLLSNPGQVITIRHLARLAKHAYESAFTIKNITSSFNNTGLWPLNRHIFTDKDFIASEVTDRPLTVNEPQTDTGDTENQMSSSPPYPKEQPILVDRQKTPPLPSTSTSVAPCALNEIRPYPKVTFERKKKRNSRKAQSTIYTDTPEYENRQREEEEKKRKKSVNERKSVKRRLADVNKKRSVSTSSESSLDIPLVHSSEEEDYWDDMKSISEEDTVEVDNFVLVKFSVAKSAIYYVGKVISFQDEDFEVKFLRRKRNTRCFLFPDVDDISTIEKKDIVAILPFTSKQGTSRTTSAYKFNVNFSGLNVR